MTRSFTIPDMKDRSGRVPRDARVKAYRTDTHAWVEDARIDEYGNATFSALPLGADISFHATWGGTTTGLKERWFYSHINAVTEGGTGASDAATARTNLGLGATDIHALKGITFADFTELTISSGAVTATQTCHSIDTESDAATDDLDTINGGGTVDILVIRPIHDDRSVVIKHNTGNIWLQGKTDITLDDISDTLLLVWDNDNSKWVDTAASGGGAGANYVVAASGAPAHVKSRADKVCDGTDDHTEIQEVIDALPATGGKVLLTEGTFNIETAITLDSYQTLQGWGRNTILTTTTADLDIITATGSSGSEKVGILLADFCIDGDAGSATNDCGIKFTYVDYSIIENVWALDNGEYGIDLDHSDHNTVSGCVTTGNSTNLYDGITLETSNYNTIENCVCSANDSGINVNGKHNAIIGNVCDGNTQYGIYLYIEDSTITGNSCGSNTDSGILIDSGIDSVISNNVCNHNIKNGIEASALTTSVLDGNDCNSNSETGIYGAFEKCNVTGNNCSYNGYYGMYMTGMADTLIATNTCVGSSQDTTDTYDDIFGTNLVECSISNNVCRAGDETNKPRYGINISNAGCANTLVTGNDCYDDGFATGTFNNSGTSTVIKSDNRGFTVTDDWYTTGSFILDCGSSTYDLGSSPLVIYNCGAST